MTAHPQRRALELDIRRSVDVIARCHEVFSDLNYAHPRVREGSRASRARSLVAQILTFTANYV